MFSFPTTLSMSTFPRACALWPQHGACAPAWPLIGLSVRSCLSGKQRSQITEEYNYATPAISRASGFGQQCVWNKPGLCVCSSVIYYLSRQKPSWEGEESVKVVMCWHLPWGAFGMVVILLFVFVCFSCPVIQINKKKIISCVNQRHACCEACLWQVSVSFLLSVYLTRLLSDRPLWRHLP